MKVGELHRLYVSSILNKESRPLSLAPKRQTLEMVSIRDNMGPPCKIQCNTIPITSWSGVIDNVCKRLKPVVSKWTVPGKSR